MTYPEVVVKMTRQTYGLYMLGYNLPVGSETEVEGTRITVLGIVAMHYPRKVIVALFLCFGMVSVVLYRLRSVWKYFVNGVDF